MNKLLQKIYLDNITSTPLLSTELGGYPYKQFMIDPWSNTKHTRMEHVTLLVITIGSEELGKSRACLDETLICTNQQALPLIDGETVIGVSTYKEVKFVTK